MGIRFYCPNGHKMNVKDFQAGQRGICPACGAKMQIPLESTRLSSRQKRSQPPTTVLEPPPNSASADTMTNFHSSAATVFVASPEPDPPAATVFAASPADPLDAAGNAVWYVQPPSGGQFGPAPSDIVRNWLVEGRLTADCLVWREGWSEWKNAGDVFPQLSPKLTIPGLEAFFSQSAETPLQVLASKPYAPPRKWQLLALSALAIVVLILIAAFLVIWIRQ